MNNHTNFEEPIQIEISQTKIVAVFSAFIVFYIIAIILWKQNILDSNIVIYFNFVYEDELYLRFVKALSRYGMSFITAIYALFLVLSIRYEELKQERLLFLLFIISFALTTIGGDLLKELIDKARPVIALSGQIAIQSIHESPAFPSGHAAKSMALALPFVFMASGKSIITNIFKILALITALLVCYSRIAQQAHFLSDVLAGIGTALFFIPIAVWLTNRFYKKMKMNEDKLNMLSRRLIFIYIGFTAILIFM
jgi:membrane-associated phospholipid phosphatase